MYRLTRPVHALTCKRLFYTSNSIYRGIAPGFFTSVWNSGTADPPTPEILKQFVQRSSKDTHSCTSPPAQTKMLVREFIDDSLYNPHYGFYAKRDESVLPEFEAMQEEDYIKNLKRLNNSKGSVHHRDIHQMRYTMTELFKPWYGHAIAKYMVSEYKLNLYPHKDLIIYEIGGGNGRLMHHILDYIERYEPSVYKRTQYYMIELSNRVTSPSFLRMPATKHECVQVLDQNIFDWDTLVTEQCFFLGMEVINRFAHDMIRYDLDKLTPHQGLVCVDEKLNYSEIFEPVGSDDLIARYLALRKRAAGRSNQHKHQPSSLSLLWNRIQHYFKRQDSNYTAPEFIPTKLFQLMEILSTYFPGHRLILADFASLFNTIQGVNGPLVQTAYKGLMVPCDTYLLPPGWYDIVFPTNFELLREMYLLTCRGSKAGNEKSVKAIKYDDFLERYGDIEQPKPKKGVPMQLMHQPNVKVFLT